ncbi:MAG: trigger factor [Thermoguttaceae bacterium]
MAHTHHNDDEALENQAALESEEMIADQSVVYEGGEGEEERPKLNLDVKIDDRSACERHITVTVSREDIDRYLDKEFSQLMPEAHVPGFRPGHAPRKLVENRFRKDVVGRVKGALLMDSLAQIHEDYDLSAIGEPELDLETVEVPDQGPMTFEFDLEVRPQFDLPQWKGLQIEKPVREFTDADIDQALKRILTNRGRLVPVDGPAEPGDYITTNLTFKHGDQVLSSAAEEVIRLRPVLSFRDGKIEGFDKAMAGVRAGETRELTTQLSEDAPNVALRSQQVAGVFEVLEVKKLQLPELTPDLLQELGGFELEADLRDAIKDTLGRRLEYQQRQRAREQITAALTVAADWELPPDLLQRQSHRELQRAVMELQRSGFGEEEIRAHENVLRQNSRASTARALKEHFILERIAEDQQIDADENDYDTEIAIIAQQTNESPRRVRARFEKQGSMDVLRNQIIERKVIDLILANAVFREVPYRIEESDVAALELTAAGGDHSEIPDAKPGGEPAEEKYEKHEKNAGRS